MSRKASCPASSFHSDYGHSHRCLLSRISDICASAHGTVVSVPSVCYLYVSRRHDLVVCRVDGSPDSAVPYLDPSVCHSCAQEEPVGISCLYATVSAYGYHKMCHILAYTRALFHHLCRRCCHCCRQRHVSDIPMDIMAYLYGALHAVRLSMRHQGRHGRGESCQRCREVIVGRWLLLTHGIISAADNTCREVSKSIVPVVGASVYYMVPKGISVMHSPEGGMHDEMLLDDMLAAVLGRHTPQHDVVACHWA